MNNHQRVNLDAYSWMLSIYREDGTETVHYFKTEVGASNYADDIMESMDTSEARETGFLIECID